MCKFNPERLEHRRYKLMDLQTLQRALWPHRDMSEEELARNNLELREIQWHMSMLENWIQLSDAQKADYRERYTV